MTTLVLLSGGLDSATVLAASLPEAHDVTGQPMAIGFDYGQPHVIELERARLIAQHYHVPFHVVTVPYMPKINDVVFAGRNLVLTGLAIAYAQAKGIEMVAVGCNLTDHRRFPDCRPPFWDALRHMALEAYGVRVLTPLLYKNKREIVLMARGLNVPIDLTWSCYDPQDGKPCGKCLACTVRDEALAA